MREVDLVVGNAEREEDAMRPDADGANPVLFPLRNLQPSVVFQETEVTSTWSTFAPAAPPPAAIPKLPDCARCGCPEEAHCKGNTRHSKAKGYGAVTCSVRHCEVCLPCIGYQETK
jgi:hypothetical protein